MRSGWLVSVVLLAGACGGGDTDPALIPGGGVRGPAISGTVNVYVIDAFTGAPVAGATVRVGPYNGTKLQGTTDASGLHVASGRGAQEIDVSAPGYATAVWIGVDGVNVTIPLVERTLTAPTGHVAGTFPAEQVPAPQRPNVRGASIRTTQPHFAPSIAPQNFLEQDSWLCGVDDEDPSMTPPCRWSVDTLAGVVIPYVEVFESNLDGDRHLVGLAAAAPVTVPAGSDQQGIAIPAITVGDVHDLTVSFRAPPGFTGLGGIVSVDFGAGGLAYLDTISPAERTVELPGLGPLGGATYEVFAFGRAATGNGSSSRRRGGLTGADLGAEVLLDDWMQPPASLMFNRTQASFAPVDGAGLYTLTFGGASSVAMIVTVLDGATLTTLPLEFSPLPGGAIDFAVNAFDVGDAFDATDFSYPELELALERGSSNRITAN